MCDSRGGSALVTHAFVSRASQGLEALRSSLADPSRRLRYVAGQVCFGSGGLILPHHAVFDQLDALGIQPWVDRAGGGAVARGR